jgi:SAM-dependent methyltransferase
MAETAMLDTKQQVQDDDYSFPYHYVPQFSPGYSQTYSWPWGIYYTSAMEFVLEKVRALQPASVADVGTGDGRLVRELAQALPGARVAGMDYSERAIQLARAMNPGLDFRCLDIINDPVGERFDVVTLIEVFEHIPLDLAANFAAALKALVADGGHLIVTVPHRNVPVSRKHFQHFTADSLRAYFEPHFILEETIFLDKRSPVVNWIKKLLENHYFILVHWGIRNRLYRAYKKFFLLSDEPRCGRLYMRFRPRTVPNEQPH